MEEKEIQNDNNTEPKNNKEEQSSNENPGQLFGKRFKEQLEESNREFELYLLVLFGYTCNS